MPSRKRLAAVAAVVIFLGGALAVFALSGALSVGNSTVTRSVGGTQGCAPGLVTPGAGVTLEVDHSQGTPVGGTVCIHFVLRNTGSVTIYPGTGNVTITDQMGRTLYTVAVAISAWPIGPGQVWEATAFWDTSMQSGHLPAPTAGTYLLTVSVPFTVGGSPANINSTADLTLAASSS